LVAKAQKTPEEGWTMKDGTPWPGNNSRDHPGMIQVCPLFLCNQISMLIMIGIKKTTLYKVPSHSVWFFFFFLTENFYDHKIGKLCSSKQSYSRNTLSKIYFYHFQVFLGHTGARDIEGNELPRLVYVSREKRPGYQHHKKAGAENALVCADSSLMFHIRLI